MAVKVFTEKIKIDHFRWDVNPLNTAVNGDEFVVVGKLSGPVDITAAATDPLTIHCEAQEIQVDPADLADAAVGDTVFFDTSAHTFTKTSASGLVPVGQVTHASTGAGDPVLFYKFAEAGNAVA
jgi:hypothetical protein